MKWTCVSIDGIVPIPAYLDENERWNGWACPYFRAKDARLIQKMLDIIGEGETITYDEDEDAYVIRTPCDEDYEEGGEEWYKGEDVDGMHLYPIGAGCWIWYEDGRDPIEGRLAGLQLDA